MNLSAPGDLILAHGGGLPEAAMLGAPVLALVVFVLLERRARRRKRDGEEDR